jgi:hypothetical protein
MSILMVKMVLILQESNATTPPNGSWSRASKTLINQASNMPKRWMARDDMGWTNGDDQEMHAKLGDLYPNGHGANLHHFFMHLKDRRIAGHDTTRERVFFSLDQLTGC